MQRHKQWVGWVVAVMLGTAAWLVPASPAHAAGTLTVTPSSVDFEEERVGATSGDVRRVTVTATGEPVTITRVDIDGAEFDYLALIADEDVKYCYDTTDDDIATPVVVTAGTSCVLDLLFIPTTHGDRNAVISFETANASNDPTVALTGTGTTGYYVAGTLGQVAAFGDAEDHGDMSEVELNAPVVDMATVPWGDGYWLTATDGGIFSFNTDFHGSMGGTRLNQPIVGMETAVDGEGYYQVASDGGIFAWGSAEFEGSTGGIRLNQPVVGMAVHPSGEGYWLVARDGGVFAFGEAGFHGSMGGTRLNQPVVGMAATPSGEGYWLVAADGGIFAFGDADFHGSTGAIRLNSPITGMASAPLGDGYWMVAEDGGIFAFKAPFHGSLPASGVTGVDDVVDIAATAPLVDLSFVSSAGRGSALRVSEGVPAGVPTRK